MKGARLAAAVRSFAKHERAKCKADVAAIMARARADVVARKALAKQRVVVERGRLRAEGCPEKAAKPKRKAARKPVELTARAVLAAARESEYKPGWERAFIAETYETLCAHHGYTGTLAAFKAWLLAHRGSVRLTRAELVATMPPKMVARSEVVGPARDEVHFIAW